MDVGGREAVGDVAPLVICCLTNYKLELSSSEARGGRDHLIHQPTCLRVALTHYVSVSHQSEERNITDWI